MGDLHNTRVVSAGDIEMAAESGRSELFVPVGSIVTPLARERADALGVTVNMTSNPTSPLGRPTGEMSLEAKAREVTAKVIARYGGDPSMLDDMTQTVLKRMSGNCACGEHGPKG
ncbi:MAG: hypothetical protein M5U23_12030 [Acidimicrobiia bacterium]|nr:hypothetical protein [Acidimicrobiia bacterium]